jgi:site-specific DNA-methyltransferase (adenine-specific)
MRLIRGDCLEIMPTLDADSIDSIVTDPPYGLSFMGKDWDHGVPGEAFWCEALRVAKPGAHLLAFGGTRTFHRLAVAIEDASWEIRDTLGWLYGSGFPKSLDVSKAIDKAAGVEREVLSFRKQRANSAASGVPMNASAGEMEPITAPATPDAERWQGWGTALKPAWEPVILARKPLAGTVAANVLAHGTGALNIDGCRIGTETVRINTFDDGAKPFGNGAGHPYTGRASTGRWPANIVHDGSDEVTALFPKTIGGVRPARRNVSIFGAGNGTNDGTRIDYDTGSAARFFYCAKASKADRDEGCEGLGGDDTRGRPTPCNHNHHPTVKPTALMRYLCRLITPPGGVILDPFCGSGSTGKAATLEGFEFIGIDTDADYLAIAEARIAAVTRQEVLALA